MTDRFKHFPIPVMPRRVRLLLQASLLAVFALGTPAGFAQSDEEETRQALKQLESEISRISTEITSDTNRQSKLQAQLRDTEKELGALQREIRENRKALQSGKQAAGNPQPPLSQLVVGLLAENGRQSLAGGGYLFQLA